MCLTNFAHLLIMSRTGFIRSVFNVFSLWFVTGVLYVSFHGSMMYIVGEAIGSQLHKCVALFAMLWLCLALNVSPFLREVCCKFQVMTQWCIYRKSNRSSTTMCPVS